MKLPALLRNSQNGAALFCLLCVSSGLSAQMQDSRLLHVPSPDWSEQVIYMIMTDRFADGDPTNNDLGHGEYLRGSGSHYNGGDLRGIIDKVPYLRDLGVTAVWITPPVLNQWWSSPYKAAGWHGYWAVDFSKVDPHIGTLEDYKDLSHALHENGMYLIQDIVANHVGNFYTYDGKYDPSDTGKHFRLLEPEGIQPVPTQYPFNLIDRLNPEHAAADIYHWTPTVNDFNSKYQEKNYMLGYLADINTENPLVIDTFKQTYSWWIEEVGVDGFRIDTVMLVDHPFWHHFLNDPDGIHPFAASIGKQDFLTFGESFSISAPFETSGEEKVTRYLGTEEKPQLGAMLGFPLYASLSRVFGEGKPTAELQHRLDAFMAHFPDPHITPTFIDNHDTRRFLSVGSMSGFEQALTALFTLPGIPILLQGTEQALAETRQALFAGGYRAVKDHLEADSPSYKLIRQLSDLRRENPVLTKGDLTALASDQTGPGLLAYKRTHGEETVLALFNTANHSIWSGSIPTGFTKAVEWQSLFSRRFTGSVRTDPDGKVALQLPARAAVLVTTRGARELDIPPPSRETLSIHVKTDLEQRPLTGDTVLRGTVSTGGIPLSLVIDGNLDAAIPFTAEEDGKWQVTLPVRDYGKTTHYFSIFAPEHGTVSERIPYQADIKTTEMAGVVVDPAQDDSGPEGSYRSPVSYADKGQKDILKASYKAGGHNLELTLEMRGITQDWVPFNGMEKVAFTIFIDVPDRPGCRDLPMLNASMPDGMEWNYGHVLSGWGNSVFTADGAGVNRRGGNLGVSPIVSADLEKRTITLLYDGAPFGLESWHGVTLYITTWDVNGEGYYLALSQEPSDFEMGGGNPDEPRIMDDLLLQLPRESTSGVLHLIPAFPSTHVEERPVYIWLPDNLSPDCRYPVLYMSDGQALFHREDSWFGATWDMDMVASRLISNGDLPPFIVVGVWNTGLNRHSEYFPQKPWQSLSAAYREELIEALAQEGKADYATGSSTSDAYLRFLVEEVKPYVDSHYPTLSSRENTLLMGSSMGGLISMYALCEYPEVFSAAACLSTHWTGKWDNLDNPIPDAFVEYLQKHLPSPDSHRIYFDHGTEGLDALYGIHQQRVDALLQERGFFGESAESRVFEGAAHNEAAWNSRLHVPLEFLFGND